MKMGNGFFDIISGNIYDAFDAVGGNGGGFLGPSSPVAGYGGYTDTGSSFNLGGIGGLLGGIGLVGKGLSGLANAYLGYKNYQLAKKQFAFQKGLANRNLANQAKIINNTYDNAAQVAAGMIGGVDANGNYGMTDQAIVDRYAANALKKHVDGSAIG